MHRIVVVRPIIGLVSVSLLGCAPVVEECFCDLNAPPDVDTFYCADSYSEEVLVEASCEADQFCRVDDAAEAGEVGEGRRGRIAHCVNF